MSQAKGISAKEAALGALASAESVLVEALAKLDTAPECMVTAGTRSTLQNALGIIKLQSSWVTSEVDHVR